MPTPLTFLNRYKNIRVSYTSSTGSVCRTLSANVQLKTYFMMNWADGTDERTDYNVMVSGGGRSNWYQDNKHQIQSAAMGKGSPEGYRLALEWAVMSRKIASPTQSSIQAFCDSRLGIDCSGFVTNYLIAKGKKPDNHTTQRNTSAASYYSATKAVNDPTAIRQGDLLVWMSGNNVMQGPGHIAVVESYRPQCVVGGNMCVCEATGTSGANPKLLDSMYEVEAITDKGGRVPCMILTVKRHGMSGSRVAVMRY